MKNKIVSAQIVEEKFDSDLTKNKNLSVSNSEQNITLSFTVRFFSTYKTELNVDIMQDAIMKLIGKYDFSSFRIRDCQAKINKNSRRC